MTDHTTHDTSSEIPHGYCHCGCGQRTNLARQTNTRKGWIEGQPVRYIAGHQTRGRTFARKDVAGQRFGYLLALHHNGRSRSGETLWLCVCDCGKNISVALANLLTGNTRSCGCQKGKLITDSLTRHGMTGSKIYRIWCHIVGRCTNPNDKAYAAYGQRGIQICDEWRNSFELFCDHASRLPHYGEPGYTLDRIDNDGNYEPGNVRWATKAEQARNTRQNLLLTYDGRTQCLAAWAEEIGMSALNLAHRLKRGWTLEKALTQPLRATRPK